MGGREHELFKQVCDKYQADAEALAAQLPYMSSPTGPTASASTRPAPVKKEEGKSEYDEFAHLEHEELPQLSASEFSVLVQSVYERYNPKKLQDVGKLLVKFQKRERDLYLEVCKKYGCHPVKFRAMDLKEK